MQEKQFCKPFSPLNTTKVFAVADVTSTVKLRVAQKTKPRFGFKIAKIPDVARRPTHPRARPARRRARETFH